MSKSFFYRLVASDFFAVVRELSDKQCAKWLRTFASDLVAGRTLDCYTQSLIDEAKKYRETKSLAGKKGMEQRYQSPNSVITELQQNDNTDITNSSSSTEAVTVTISEAVTESEAKDLKALAVKRQPAAKKTDEDWLSEIKSNPAYRDLNFDVEIGKAQAWCMTKGRKCSRAFLLNWFNRAEKNVTVLGTIDRPRSFREQVNKAAGDAFVNGDY